MKTPHSTRVTQRSLLALVLVFAAAPNVNAQAFVTNGGFENGFAGWTRVDQLGSIGTFFLQTGLTSPSNGNAVPAPPGGIMAAMTDAQGPGSHVLYQDITIPAAPVPAALLTFDLFVGNRATAFSTPSPASLDFSTPALNQQARVDVIATGADPFSVSASDVLLSAFQTTPGSPLISGYSTMSVDLTGLFAANPGATVRLRFAEVDNVAAFQLGIDNINIAIPEPSAIVLCSFGSILAIRRARRRSG